MAKAFNVFRAWLASQLNLLQLWVVLLISIPLTVIYLCCSDGWLAAFWTIFTLRYARLVGNILGYCCYAPSPTAVNPKYTARDVTVILPTIDPTGPDFAECLLSILSNGPRAVLIVTVGDLFRGQCLAAARDLKGRFPNTDISVSALSAASKRRQISHAMPGVRTAITVLADDHVFWPSLRFLTSVLAPFEDDRVGAVATKKRVRRSTDPPGTWRSIVNFIACNYLERHNWELRASNGIDGGVFVVSGRTAVYRTRFLQSPALLSRFCHEKFMFGLLGGGGDGQEGLGPDDDNFLTREAITTGWLVRFQDTAEGTVETTLGEEWPRFRGQLVR